MCSVMTGRAFLIPWRVTSDAFDLARRNVDIQKCPLGQSLGEYLAHGRDGKTGRLREIKMVAGYQTESQARHTKNRCFKRAGNSA